MDEPLIPPLPPVNRADELPADPPALPPREDANALTEVVADAEIGLLQPDEANIMLLYMSFLGDIPKVAAAANLRPDQVVAMAAAKGWDKRVAVLTNVRDAHGAEAMAKELNRTVNLVQALRLRSLLDAIIRRTTRNKVNLDRFIEIEKRDRTGRVVATQLSMRNAVELVKAVEIAQRLTYTALGDSLGERNAASAEGGDSKVSLGVLKALAAGQPSRHIPGEDSNS